MERGAILGAEVLLRRTLPMAAVLVVLLGVVNLALVYRWDMVAVTLAAKVRPGHTGLTADPNAPTMLSVLHPKGVLPLDATAMVTSQPHEALGALATRQPSMGGTGAQR